MKRMLAALLLLCALAPPAAAEELVDQLMAMEKKLWAAWGRKDGEPFRKMLAANAVQIVAGTEPLHGRDAVIEAVTTQSCELRGFAHEEPRLHRLGRDAIAVSYTATQDATCDGVKLPPKVASTSIYLRQQGRWMQRYYQETPLP